MPVVFIDRPITVTVNKRIISEQSPRTDLGAFYLAVVLPPIAVL